MRRNGWNAWLALFGVAALLLAGSAVRADCGKEHGPAEAQAEHQGQMSDQEMQAMMAMAAPGEHHEHLEPLLGDWTYTAKMWMPGAPEPMELTGTMHAEPLLDGRFVEYHYKGDFMGMPFHGIGIDGYDNQKGHYTGMWMDNMGTYTLSYTGTCQDGGKKRWMRGKFTDPTTGQEVNDKGLTTIRDDGTILMESWRVMPDGQEVKMMELTLSRSHRTPPPAPGGLSRKN